MPKGTTHVKALPWGGSVGFRFSKAEAERLGIRPGVEFDIDLRPAKTRIDLSHLRTFRDGIQTEGLDRAYGDALDEEAKRWGSTLHEA